MQNPIEVLLRQHRSRSLFSGGDQRELVLSCDRFYKTHQTPLLLEMWPEKCLS